MQIKFNFDHYNPESDLLYGGFDCAKEIKIKPIQYRSFQRRQKSCFLRFYQEKKVVKQHKMGIFW